MIQKKIDLLKEIDKMKNNNVHPDYESLPKLGFDISLINNCISEGLIQGNVFGLALTYEGEKALREYLLIEKGKDKIKVMFDNDILNKIAEGIISLDEITKSGKFEFYATHIQIDQASKCPNENKRQIIILNLTKLSPIIIPTESGVFGVSRWGEFKFSDGNMMESLRKGNIKHTEDALIGETAIKRIYY